jgi:hypothetical protein
MVAEGGHEDVLFALAELSFLYGQTAKKPDYSLAAAVYAYAFLFPEDAAQAPPGRFERHLLARDRHRLRVPVQMDLERAGEGSTHHERSPGLRDPVRNAVTETCKRGASMSRSGREGSMGRVDAARGAPTPGHR